MQFYRSKPQSEALETVLSENSPSHQQSLPEHAGIERSILLL
jgi:hypothetical protein